MFDDEYWYNKSMFLLYCSNVELYIFNESIEFNQIPQESSTWPKYEC